MFVIARHSAKCFGKTYCVQKYKKNGYREFDFSGTLRACLHIDPSPFRDDKSSQHTGAYKTSYLL